MSADDRHAVRARRIVHAVPNRFGAFVTGRPNRVDDRGRAAAHRGDVAEVDHHAAVAGEPRLAVHELVEQSLDREQREAGPVRIGNRRAVVAHAARQRRVAETAIRDRDVALVLHASRAAQTLAEFGEHDRLDHDARRDSSRATARSSCAGG
jgi:hypothetical protein